MSGEAMTRAPNPRAADWARTEPRGEVEKLYVRLYARTGKWDEYVRWFCRGDASRIPPRMLEEGARLRALHTANPEAAYDHGSEGA